VSEDRQQRARARRAGRLPAPAATPWRSSRPCATGPSCARSCGRV